jgi:hypothetical protein
VLACLAACGRDVAVPERRVPPALAPSFALLDSALTPAMRDSLRVLLPDRAIDLHLSLGMWLRNNGGLWRGGPVADSLRARGVRHPDDMSHVILQAYGLYLRERPIDLDALIRALPPPPNLDNVPTIRLDLPDSGQ